MWPIAPVVLSEMGNSRFVVTVGHSDVVVPERIERPTFVAGVTPVVVAVKRSIFITAN